MSDSESQKVPYVERSDDEKLVSNWKKANGLYERKDWSACIMRVATSAEIAANIYIRQFLQNEHNLPESFVDSLLKNANGLLGKYQRLITPASMHLGTWDELKSLQRNLTALNTHRNSVAHEGLFKNEPEAKEAYLQSLSIVTLLAPSEAAKLSLPFDI